MDSCFSLFKPDQHGIASKQAQVSKNEHIEVMVKVQYFWDLAIKMNSSIVSTNVLVAIVIKLK